MPIFAFEPVESRGILTPRTAVPVGEKLSSCPRLSTQRREVPGEMKILTTNV